MEELKDELLKQLLETDEGDFFITLEELESMLQKRTDAQVFRLKK